MLGQYTHSMSKQKQYFECTALDFKNQNMANEDNLDFNKRCASGATRSLLTGVVGPIGASLDSQRHPVYVNPNNNEQFHGKASFDEWWNLSPNTKSVGIDLELIQDPTTKIWQHNVNGFWPLNGKGWDAPPAEPGSVFHSGDNGLFTLHCTTQFVYSGGEEFTFSGDDDVWIYVDGKLAVDIGGIHSETSKIIMVDDLNTDKSKAWDLKVGCRYTMDLFFAERCCCASNFNFDTSLTPVRETESGNICPNSQDPGKYCTQDDQCKQNGAQYFCYENPKTKHGSCMPGTRAGGIDHSKALPGTNTAGGINGMGGVGGVNGTAGNGTNTGGNGMSGEEIGLLIGIIVGALVFILLAVLLFVWIGRQKKHQDQHLELRPTSQAKTIVQAMEQSRGVRKGGHARKSTFAGWIKHIDEGSQRYYYQNESSGETRWGDPVPATRENPMRKKNSSTPKISDWVEHYDETYQKSFFHNEKTGETTWERPRTKTGAPLC